jgi:hypothetical protein
MAKALSRALITLVCLGAAQAHAQSVCSIDADCGWDDPCAPSRCVVGQKRGECEESLAPPGTCACIALRTGADKICALRRTTPVPEPRTCDPRAAMGCGVDPSAGVCIAPKDDVVGRTRHRGPYCACGKDGRCTYEWVEPVACKDERDCWVGRNGEFVFPAKRPKKKRGKKVRPCKDGELTPACTDGMCTLRHWKC